MERRYTERELAGMREAAERHAALNAEMSAGPFPVNGSEVLSTVAGKGAGLVVEQYDGERVKVEWYGGSGDVEMEFRDELELG